MFWRKNKKNRHTPAYPSFDIKKVGFRGIRTCYPDDFEVSDNKYQN